jgi:large subunit ribosomal protein L9
MKILLLKYVKNIGSAGDVKTVSDGYARNFLLPRGLAKIAAKQKEAFNGQAANIKKAKKVKDRKIKK